MLEETLVKKVSEYLEKIKIKPLDGSIEYLKLKKNVPQKNGTEKDMHVIGFLSNFNKENADGIKGCSIYIDVKTNDLSFIVTPYYLKEIL
jgi:hypothetical protein